MQTVLRVAENCTDVWTRISSGRTKDELEYRATATASFTVFVKHLRYKAYTRQCRKYVIELVTG